MAFSESMQATSRILPPHLSQAPRSDPNTRASSTEYGYRRRGGSSAVASAQAAASPRLSAGTTLGLGNSVLSFFRARWWLLKIPWYLDKCQLGGATIAASRRTKANGSSTISVCPV